MKPVMMTKYADEDANCLTACVASLLECDIESLPCFSSMGTDWFRHTVEYLEARGFGTIFVPAERLQGLIVSDCLCICIFKVPNSDVSHAKLGRWHSEFGGELWNYSITEEFDPNKYGVATGDLASVLLVFPKMDYSGRR